MSDEVIKKLQEENKQLRQTLYALECQLDAAKGMHQDLNNTCLGARTELVNVVRQLDEKTKQFDMMARQFPGVVQERDNARKRVEELEKQINDAKSANPIQSDCASEKANQEQEAPQAEAA